MPHAAYVPLRVFSCFSMLEGASRPREIGPRARELGFPAAALCDRNGLYAAMAFSEGCKLAGVQPIIGALLGVARPTPEGTPRLIDWLPLYAQDETGYRNLCALVSSAHLDRPLEEEPHVGLDALEGRTEGLIALTGGGEGALARLIAEGQIDAAEACTDRFAALFPGRLYVEISRRGDPVEEAAEDALIDLAYARDLPLVGTNPSCFDTEDFHEAAEAMLCIADGTQLERDDRRRCPAGSWIQPAAEIEARFADLPEALANTLVIALRCAYAAPKRDPILPSIAGDAASEGEQLCADARAGLEARLAAIAAREPLTDEAARAYRERLEFELEVIVETGFSGY
ncbi:MAG: PHP domain-containing protein, partial [Sphingomonadaceae bacterium]|nr:PHP domain-containing protein [Sphingomonadaceae bacterium]